MEHLSFNLFADPIKAKLDSITTSEYLVMKATVDQEELWAVYLNAYPKELNTIFRERLHYDGSYDRNFVINLGCIVALDKQGNRHTVWDTTVDGYFQQVADALDAYIKTKPLTLYKTDLKSFGANPNKDSELNLTWTHFYSLTPSSVYLSNSSSVGSFIGSFNNDFNVFRRGLQELSKDSFEVVLELINSNSIYRGTEFKPLVSKFYTVYKRIVELGKEQDLDYLYVAFNTLDRATATFKNSVIGTLLSDISEGVELNRAVGSYEHKVAPTSYKRSSSIVTAAMIKNAQQTLTDLGVIHLLDREAAAIEDIPVNNLLFTSSNSKATDLFSSIINEADSKVKSLSKVNEIDLNTFLSGILPSAVSVEAFVSNNLKSNLVALTKGANEVGDTPLFKWDNQFSWSYNGDVADSIKERVKRFGGDVEGDLRVSLSWYNSDDLDMSCITPSNKRICFSRKQADGGYLDLDMNGLDKHSATEPVENIIFKNKSHMLEGKYKFLVNQYCLRNNNNVGFELQVEYNGIIQTYVYDKKFTGSHIKCLEVDFDGNDFTISFVNTDYLSQVGSSSDPFKGTEEDVWGIKTSRFIPVNSIMYSPNHWNTKVGNKHLFLMLDECKPEEDIRGIYNEYLNPTLNEHRKVFELLGSKSKVAPTDNQLAGLGFSLTTSNSFYVRVTTNNTKQIFKVTI